MKDSEKEILIYAIAIIAVFIILFTFSSIKTPHLLTPVAVVSSWSMEPVLHVGDIVIVTGQENYTPGDIVLYYSGQDIIVHRIIKTQGYNYTVKGDANPVPDPIHPTNDIILGKVEVVVPYIGSLRLMLNPLIEYVQKYIIKPLLEFLRGG
ncbi:signal peptidase I [Thermofilum sp.]|uniref:signal peptidase I n=1 Tax=Thermofilum sp. TaxID=1961369 RepID=UPI00258BAD27|nr:signal peptidase I [Thermofilum sp.]